MIDYDRLISMIGKMNYHDDGDGDDDGNIDDNDDDGDDDMIDADHDDDDSGCDRDDGDK